MIALLTRTPLLVDQGRLDESIRAAQEAVDTASSTFGEQHKHTISALMALTNSYAFAQQTKLALGTAERTHRLAVETYRDDPQHPMIIDSRTAYARALSYSGQLERAIEMQDLAAEDASEVYGESSMVVGLILQNRVENELLLGRIEEALSTSERALSILREHLEPESLNYIAAVNARGKAQLMARRIDAADTLAESYHGAKRIFGPLHRHAVNTHGRVALALAYAGRLDDAMRESEQAVEDLHESGDESSHDPLWARGVVLQLTGSYREALQSHLHALARVESHPEADLDRARVLSGLGLAQLELGSFDDAAESLGRARALFRSEQQRITPHHADALVALGRLYMALGDPDTAVGLLKQADDFWRVFDEGSRWAGEAASWLGRCYFLQGRTEAAESAFRRAARTLASSPFPSDRNLLSLAGS